MAAYIRTRLLLVLTLLCLFSFGSLLGSKAASRPADLPNVPVLRPGEPPVKDAPAVAAAAGASQPRRATGWKLSEEEACREDLTRLCPKHTWANNLAVLECLQDRREETEIAPDCNHLLWNYKLNLTTDPKFESVATEVCKSTIAEIKECNDEERGRGYLVSCLVDHRGNISEYQCNQYITKMTSIIFSDYRLICGFMDKCKEDVNNLHCGSINVGHKDIHSQGEVISCLEKALVKEAEQPDRVRTIKDECQKAILRVAELSSDDFHLDRHLYFSCRDDRERFCQNIQAGEGKVYKCLFNHKFEEAMSEKCRDALTVRQKLISQDYRVSYSLAKACKLDLRKQRCSLDTSLPRAREARLSYLLLCLEAAVHRGRSVSGECQGEMLDYRRMLMEDFSLSPEIVLHCRAEIETHCSGLHRKGRTLHCLMRIGRDRSTAIEGVCQSALQTLIQSADLGSDYRIDRALNEACESVIQTACKHIRNGDPMILSCLMEHLYTEKMVEECEHRLLELQYFISRDWKLDPVLYKKCQDDAARLCHTHGWNETSELMPPGAVFSCLYRHAYRTEEQGRRVNEEEELSRDCKMEVQRILHQRALDVKLDPELQKRCMTDLGKWCSEKTDTGQELDCLQDHLEDLGSACREVVGNLTELESEDIQIDALLVRACEPIIQAHCHDVADNQIDTGDLMECLVQNKHQKEMNDKCSVGVTHFQLIQMKDFRFSYKFKMACKEDVLRLCPNIKKKVDVVICLSTTVRNDTLQDAKEQRVSLKCRKQLRVEELEMSEDIRLEPELYDPCKSDISRLCPNVAFGNAQMIECLKEQKKQLSQRCHQRIFRLQEVEMSDPELDYQLMRVCKQMIKRFCTEADARTVLQCLKQNKNSELMDPKCKQMITKRQITQNTDYRLNPVLRKACRADIPKFCQNILNKASEDSELEGQVIGCLKLKYADQRLSPDCEDQIRVILQESALDYRLDPQLQLHCSEEISRLCAEEAAAQEQTGQVEECLKVNLLKLKQDTCKKEVLNMLKESKADIFVDPVLHTACALDLKHHCAAITPGRGRQMSCLMETLQDKRVRLQPECKKRLQDRIDMWSYAAKVAPAEGFSDLAVQVMTSPSKNYILLVITLSVCVLFLVGLICGRLTKRVTRELKDR
ncbi:Golgi apparatus protein 1-like isoform X1 [Takifugu rubripes]|uniref:Golgi apparatus protein 1-like isoform X1 n=1 Tax=Takifugu rubripes TaxID=31033 RepID=UPI0005D1E245|nr:Golgi apparatus protein 1-like isoform X1 [Takifugu rubripes]|eukprot:XP_011608148.1 PREDICTED: Golgi apparatus protein 1-like isoform X1 [Takifugu rubripes]